MTIRESVFSALTSASPSFRVYPNIRKQGSPLPAVVVTFIYRTDEEDLASNDLALANVHVQTDAYSTLVNEADAIATQVRALMLSAPDFRCITRTSGVDEYEDDTGLYRVRSEFSIWKSAP